MQSALVALALLIASQHGLNTNHFLATIQCESNWNPTIEGDDGNSLGIAQISMLYHPEITSQEAKDPTFALNWMAEEWETGNASSWSCWRLLKTKYGTGEWPS